MNVHNSIFLPFLNLRCPARECHSPHKCEGNLDTSFSASHLEDCIRICKERPSCKWYTLDKAIDSCVLYENCTLHTEVCDTCATGPEDCLRGYHGKYLIVDCNLQIEAIKGSLLSLCIALFPKLNTLIGVISLDVNVKNGLS